MKNLITFLAAVLITATAFAQVPNKMSYQAVVRDANNNLLANTQISMIIAINEASPTGTPVYTETQTPTTNANGLVSIVIGDGAVISGDMATIPWIVGAFFLETGIDPQGGTNYTITSTSQILPAPMAIYAESSGSQLPGPTGPKGDPGAAGAQGATGQQGATGAQGPTGLIASGATAGNTPYWDGSAWVTNSSTLYNDGSKIGIGRTNPRVELDVAGDLYVDGVLNVNGVRTSRTIGTTGQSIQVGPKGTMVMASFDIRCSNVSIGAILFIKHNGDVQIMSQASSNTGASISATGNVLNFTLPCNGTVMFTFTSTANDRVTVVPSGTNSFLSATSAKWISMYN